MKEIKILKPKINLFYRVDPFSAENLNRWAAAGINQSVLSRIGITEITKHIYL